MPDAKTHTNDQPEQLLSRSQLKTRWGCCIETIKRRQKAGLLKPIYLSARMVRYSIRNIQEIEMAAGLQ